MCPSSVCLCLCVRVLQTSLPIVQLLTCIGCHGEKRCAHDNDHVVTQWFVLQLGDFCKKRNGKHNKLSKCRVCVIKIEHIAAYFCRLERICWWIQLNICSCLHTCDNVTEVSLGGMYSSRAQHAGAYFWCAFPYCPTKCSDQTSEFVCIRAVVGETYPLTYSPHYDSLCVFIA